MIVLESIWAPSWGSFSVMLAPWSAKVGPKIVFEPSYLRKSDLSRNITFSNGFGHFFSQDGSPRRPTIAPRPDQDRLGSLFLPLEFSLRFWIVFGSVLVPIWSPKWCPWGGTKLGFGRSWGAQDGLEIVLVRISCRLVVRVRFFCPLGLVLGSFLGAPGVVLVLLGGS